MSKEWVYICKLKSYLQKYRISLFFKVKLNSSDARDGIFQFWRSTLLLLCSSTPYFMFKEATQQWTAKRAISCWKKNMGTYTQYTYHMWITALLWVSSSMLSLSSPSWVAVCLPSQPGWVAVSSPSPAGWPAVCSPLVQQGDWYALFTKLGS